MQTVKDVRDQELHKKWFEFNHFQKAVHRTQEEISKRFQKRKIKQIQVADQSNIVISWHEHLWLIRVFQISAEQENHNKFLKSFSSSCFVIDDDEHFSTLNDQVDYFMINQSDEFETSHAKFSSAFFVYEKFDDLQIRKRFDLLRNNQKLSKIVLKQYKQQRHFQ